jgi:hypothetical protein
MHHVFFPVFTIDSLLRKPEVKLRKPHNAALRISLAAAGAGCDGCAMLPVE